MWTGNLCKTSLKKNIPPKLVSRLFVKHTLLVLDAFSANRVFYFAETLSFFLESEHNGVQPRKVKGSAFYVLLSGSIRVERNSPLLDSAKVRRTY